MIEFLLVFGLGFLSAVLLVMLVAPGVHGRIVRYTENRIRATLPISPQEVRAQRDMARAVYAAENAKARQELKEERDRAVTLQLKIEALTEDNKRLNTEHGEMRDRIETLEAEAADLLTRLGQEENARQELHATIEALEESVAAKDLELEDMSRHRSMLTGESDNLRIDLSARDTDIENLKLRLGALREERDGLRNEVRQMTTRAKEAERRLGQEESRLQRLEDKLACEMSERADRETALERRQQEIERLKEKLKKARLESRKASSPLPVPASGAQDPKTAALSMDMSDVTAAQEPLSGSPSAISDLIDTTPSLAAMAEELRDKAGSLSKHFLTSDGSEDAKLRDELAEVAAGMVALTAAAEGRTSPLRKILSGKFGSETRLSLAARSKAALAALEAADNRT